MNNVQLVMLVDMQEFFLQKMASGEKEVLIRRQLQVIQECKQSGIPLVIFEFAGMGATIDPILKEAEGFARVFVKRHEDGMSLFAACRLVERLAPKETLLMGVCASHCVLATAQSLVERGYPISTSSDLIADPCDCHQCDNRRRRRLSQNWYQANGLFYDGPLGKLRRNTHESSRQSRSH